jgi:phosphoribosyl 1,2-cyclic phosphate phosphodiesterase
LWNRDWQHPAHLNLADARELAAELQGTQTWLTHLTHYMGLHAATNKFLSDGVQLAHDGLVLEVE